MAMFKYFALAALPLLAACTTTAGAAPERPLTSWTFVSIDGKAPVSKRTSLDILPTRIAVNVGCNGMGGSLKVAAGQLIVGPMISTRMYCEGIMDQESAVAELLGASPAFFIEGNRMAIRSATHSAELVKAPTP